MGLAIIIRLVLLILGILFLVLSFAGAVLEMARGTGKVRALGNEAFNPLADIAKPIDAVSKFVETVKTAPQWLALFVVGVILIFVGAFLPLSF
jgi:hypothetical protein